MSGIFISYRRDDSQAIAGRLFDRLAHRFGKASVFRDIDAIEPGARFAEVIAERIGACDTLIALIGNGWLDAKDGQGRRRLDLPTDFVRMEIAEALAQGKLVIPALIEGTAMPARDALPAEISALADRNALPVSDSRFDFDVGRLVSVIDKAIAPQVASPASTALPQRRGLWARLSDGRTQRTLAFLGAGVAAVAGATWTAYVHFAEKQRAPTPDVAATQGGIAAGGNVTATAPPGGIAVVASGPVTIGITLAEYEERFKRRERELREEAANTSRADKDRIALLERQLAAAEAAVKSPEQGLEKYNEVLASASRSLGELGLDVPAAQLERARQALARGDTAEAERLFEQALGHDKAHAATAAYQLGQLAESRIDYAGAAKHYGEAVKLQPRNPEYLGAAGNMARTLGQYDEAQPLLVQALAIRQKALGPEHPDVAQSLNNLARLHRAQGQYAKAEPLYHQSLAIMKKALGPEHTDVADGLNNLSALYHAQGEYAKAEPLFRQSLAIRKKALGPEHPDVAASLNNLAAIYYAQGQYAKAEPLYQQALAIMKKALGPEHPDSAQGLNNLALLRYAQGEYAKAEPLYQQSLAIRKKALGPEHPDVAASLNNLAALYLAQGQYAKAEPLLQHSLAIMKNALGHEHPNVATSLNNLAALFYAQGQYAKAEPLYQQSLAIMKQALGPEHPDVAQSLNNLAALFYAQGQYAKAEPLYQQALAIVKKALGPEHPDVAQGLNNLAVLYYAQGQYAKAEPLNQEALAIWKKALGREHPKVATALENYASLLTALKRDKEAADLRAQAQAIQAKLAGK